MLLQRLVADDKIGFNYDYMGSAEFEFGATRVSREALARLLHSRTLTAVKTRFFARWGRSMFGPVDVIVFGSEKMSKDFGLDPKEGSNVNHDLMVVADKESPRLDNEKVLAWMSVHAQEPILIVRDNAENLERGTKFLWNFIDQMIEAGALEANCT